MIKGLLLHSDLGGFSLSISDNWEAAGLKFRAILDVATTTGYWM